jgi:GMP synthase (glutamine-hydrolysing)
MNTSPARTPQQTVPILDFGAQYVQLIARRVREAGVHSVLVRPDISLEELRALNPIGIILSGGPASVYEDGAPRCDKNIFDLGVPVLGICYGMQLAAQLLGGDVKPGTAREYGRVKLQVLPPQNSALSTQHSALSPDIFAGIPTDTTVWMSHGDQVQSLGPDFISLASTPTCPMAAMRHKSRPFFGVQFHPEVTHTPHGTQIIENFLYKVCNAAGTWRMGSFVETATNAVRNQVKNGHVICGLSGGVDSSVLAALLHKAIGNQLTCIFVDNGLLRKNERQSVEATFRDHFKIDLRVVDASNEFLTALKGVTEPQEKRKIIGKTFIDVFKREAAAIKDAKFLAQGTLYPDVIESGHSHLAGGAKNSTTANIKLHHNVGGLPEQLGFELVEPLRDLFKDEVRKLGELLGLPEHLVWRHPFPGPGLAVRCIGEITEDKLAILRDADEIFLEEIIAENLYRSTAQTFAAILPIRAVGVMGDGRSYHHVIALRSVDTSDFMTADWSRIPYEVLARVSNRIVNEVRGISRVVYDITSKPPGTIEWE